MPSLSQGIESCWTSRSRCAISGWGSFDEAEGYLYRAISLKPSTHIAHIYLAQIEERRGNLPAAEAQAREAIRLRVRVPTPKFCPPYHGELAQILELEGNLKGARDEYQAEIQEDPASPEGQQRLLEVEVRIRQGSPAR